MTGRRWIVVASTLAVVASVAAASAALDSVEPASASAHSTTSVRPRGFVEDCSRIRGVMARREYGLERNLVVGPLAILRAGQTLGYAESEQGIYQKLFVQVKGGHRVTLELPRPARATAGLAFGPPETGTVRLQDARRVVSFVACERGERAAGSIPDGWPVSGWVGFLMARSPHCVPLRVWVDDEPRPRRAVIRFGVARCR